MKIKIKVLKIYQKINKRVSLLILLKKIRILFQIINKLFILPKIPSLYLPNIFILLIILLFLLLKKFKPFFISLSFGLNLISLLFILLLKMLGKSILIAHSIIKKATFIYYTNLKPIISRKHIKNSNF